MAVSQKHQIDTTPLPASETSPGDGSQPQDQQDLIIEVATARRDGAAHASSVKKLLRRAGQRNRAALDRLAR